MQAYFKLMAVGLAALSCSALFAQEGQPSQQAQPKADVVANAGKAEKGLKVTGLIKDAATGKPLPAISVSIPNFQAALTDDDGKFTIVVPDYNATLFISGQGFQIKEVALKGRKSVAVSLYEESFNSLYDYATLPFGLKPKNQVVNALTSLSTDGNWQRSLESTEGFMQGRVPGLTPIRRSGTPNTGASLLLRGYSSIYGTNQPLIIVDGMLFDNNDYGNSLIPGHYTNPLANIDVKDIENITVIKDAVSTYGTKAANGVILITTTHAKDLATKIDAAVYGGINFRPDNLPVMGASDYRTYLSDVLKSRGWSSQRIQSEPYMNDDPANPDYARYHNNTDWQDQVFKKSYSNNLFLKVTGGDNIAKYALSLGYVKNAGVTKATDLTKYNVRFNGDLNLTKKLTAQTNLAYTYYEQNLLDQGLSYKTNPIYLALVKSPLLHKNMVSDEGIVSPNLAETDTFGVSNPVAAIQTIRGNSKVYRFFGSMSLKYQLTKSINLYSLVGVSVDEVREQTFVPRKGIANDTLLNAIADSRLGGQARRLKNMYNDTYIDYNHTFKRIHSVHARGGIRYLHSANEQDYALGYNSSTDDFISVGTGVSSLRRVGGDIGTYSWVNTYAGVDYGLSNKYFLSANVAVDGSSRFGDKVPYALKLSGNSFAVMPSVGAAWLLSSEKFMAGVNFIDLLKLRASYGLTGNDDIGNYTAQQTYTSQNLLGMQGLVRSNIANPALQWESVSKLNAGIDASLVNERISFSVDVFKNKTSKMLMYEPMSTVTGYTYALTNTGAMETVGMEGSITGRIINKSSLKWDMGVVLSKYRNKVTALPGNNYILTNVYGATILTEVGVPANFFYGYKTNGIYSSDEEAASSGIKKRMTDGSLVSYTGGDVRFVDVNKDGIIDESDRFGIGNLNPDFTGAVINKLTWKNFSLELMINFSKGNKIYNGMRHALEAQSSANNQLERVANRWRSPGQITNMPKATWGDPMGNSSFSDRWIEDGSYARLKEASISYHIPFKSSNTVKYATIYVTGNNLLTFTNYLGYDPEFMAAESIMARGIDTGQEPQFRSVTAGLRIGL